LSLGTTMPVNFNLRLSKGLPAKGL